jgi:hypothetical protein
MEVATGQWKLIWRLGLHKELNTLFIVNKVGQIGRTASLAEHFLSHGVSLKHTAAPECMRGEEVLDYLGTVSDLASEVLAAAK